jgi:DNA polymerase V
MGVPLFQIKELVARSGVNVLSSNYALYRDMSGRVMDMLRQFSPRVETYSIDEAFLDVSSLNAPLADAGREMKARVYKATGIPVSVGFARTKTLSKIANDLAKKSQRAKGVLDLTDSRYLDLTLERTPVGEVWGIGPAYARLLTKHGITNARQLRDVDLRWARKTMTVVGARVIQELRGVACLPLEMCPPPRKSVTVSRSFGEQVETLREIKEAVATFLSRAAEKVRRHGMLASAVTVFITTNRFSEVDQQYQNLATVPLAYATDATPELLSVAMRSTERIYRNGFRYKKAGVMLTGLVPRVPSTERMFGAQEFDRERKLSGLVDEINGRFGRDTIRFGACGFAQKWKTKAGYTSHRYTTRWDELMVAG